jgi:hypothetical protein
MGKTSRRMACKHGLVSEALTRVVEKREAHPTPSKQSSIWWREETTPGPEEAVPLATADLPVQLHGQPARGADVALVD